MKSEQEIRKTINRLNQEVEDCVKSLEAQPWLKYYDEEHISINEDIRVLGEQIEILNWVLDEK